MKPNVSLLKKLTISTLLIGAGSVSMLSHAEVTLLVDDHIKVTAINGQELQQSAFQPLTKKFTLQSVIMAHAKHHESASKFETLINC